MEGIAVRPYQEELAVPGFEARGAYFDGESSYASTGGTTVVAGGSGLISLWFRLDDPSWNASVRRVFQFRIGTTAVMELYTTGNGRLSFRLHNNVANSIRRF